MKIKLSKKQKIILIVVLAVLILAGLLAARIFWWQGRVSEIRTFFSQILEKEQLPDKVREAVEKLKSNPQDADSYLAIAAYKREKGEYSDAIKIYLAALEFRPTDTLLLMNIAELYERTKQYSEAETAYQKVIETNPKWTNSYRNLVSLYLYNLKEKQSEIPKILELGLKNNADEGIDAEFIGQLAVYYKDFGPKEEAIKWYKKLIELDPTNETAKKELAELKSNQ